MVAITLYHVLFVAGLREHKNASEKSILLTKKIEKLLQFSVN